MRLSAKKIMANRSNNGYQSINGGGMGWHQAAWHESISIESGEKSKRK